MKRYISQENTKNKKNFHSAFTSRSNYSLSSASKMYFNVLYCIVRIFFFLFFWTIFPWSLLSYSSSLIFFNGLLQQFFHITYTLWISPPYLFPSSPWSPVKPLGLLLIPTQIFLSRFISSATTALYCLFLSSDRHMDRAIFYNNECTREAGAGDQLKCKIIKADRFFYFYRYY